MHGAYQHHREVTASETRLRLTRGGRRSVTCMLAHRCLHTDDTLFLKSMREAIHEILTDVSDSFSTMIDMALANEIRVRVRSARGFNAPPPAATLIDAALIYQKGHLNTYASAIYASDVTLLFDIVEYSSAL